MLRRLSLLLFPFFGLALLLLRHHPIVAAHWLAWLQAPRVAGFGVALWWALKQRAERKGGGWKRYVYRDGTAFVEQGPRSRLPPSHIIAASLLLADGLIAAWGFWTDWSWVRWGSVVAWLVVAAIGWRAR